MVALLHKQIMAERLAFTPASRQSQKSKFGKLIAAAMMLMLAAIMTCAGGDKVGDNLILAATPPMGWNSWDSYGLRISEHEFRDNVSVLASKLKPVGYTYAVIDEGWFLANPEERPHPERLKYEIDANGRYIPVAARFPSAIQDDRNTGFTALAAWVHSQGLKFGIHIVRGIPRESVQRHLPIEGSAFSTEDAADQSDACPWDPTNWGVKDSPAGQAWYDSLLRQYASWGVDFLKVDCIANNPYKLSEIRQIHLAIQHSGRPIVLSLSPGPTALQHAYEVGSLSQMWRVSNDIWDVWDGSQGFPRTIKSQFDVVAQWVKFARPGNWPDADMLPIGELRPYPDVGPGPRHTRLTADEQRTQISLWAFARSPLIVGANLTALDDETLQLLSNADILRIDQSALASRQVLHEGEVYVWTADFSRAEHAVAVFNTGDTSVSFDRTLSSIGLPNKRVSLRNVWEGAVQHHASSLHAQLPPHAVTVDWVKPE
jgi:alpha-galactosidase